MPTSAVNDQLSISFWWNVPFCLTNPICFWKTCFKHMVLLNPFQSILAHKTALYMASCAISTLPSMWLVVSFSVSWWESEVLLCPSQNLTCSGHLFSHLFVTDLVVLLLVCSGPRPASCVCGCGAEKQCLLYLSVYLPH